MERKTVVLLEGDGIGPEITAATLHVLEVLNLPIDWIKGEAGLKAEERTGTPLPDETVELIRKHGVALKGPMTTPVAGSIAPSKNYRSINIALRQTLELYANFRPVKSMPGVRTRFDNIDLIFIRENTEGLYSGLEHEIVPGVVTSLKVSTRKACERIAEFAFRCAKSAGRKKVTGVHKANIMKMSDGLALECYREAAQRHPEIEYDERIIDATAMGLVLNPERFDVLLMENLYGDILSDLGAGLVGGLGLAPSANFGEHGAVFEAVHGSAPDIAGKRVANPTALLLSAALMIRHFGWTAEGDRLERAIETTYRAGKDLTPDVGGSGTTDSFAQAVIGNLG